MRFVERVGDQFREILPTTCSIQETSIRVELRRLLADQFHLVDPDVMILAENLQTWNEETSIDLLGIHKSGCLVVVALTADMADKNAMELLAIRHAALVSTLTTTNLMEAHKAYLGERGNPESADAERRILRFLGAQSLDAIRLSEKPRIMLVAQEFSSELSQSVVWLNAMGLDIQCIDIDLYRVGDYYMMNAQLATPEPLRSGFQIEASQSEVRATPEPEAPVENVQARETIIEKSDSSADVAAEAKVQAEKVRETPAPQTSKPKRTKVKAVETQEGSIAVSPTLHSAVSKAITSGNSPQKIADILPNITVLFRILPGELASDAFKAANRDFRSNVGMEDDSSDFYSDSGQLFIYEGKTYALARLTDENGTKAVANLTKAFPEIG